MANSITIINPKSDSTLTNHQIPVQGLVDPANDPVTVSLFQNNNPVAGQQNKQANVMGTNFNYTFTQVAAGSDYSVKAESGSTEATVTGLTVTA